MARTIDQILAFRHGLTDAVTSFEVTQRTKLVTLHRHDLWTSEGRELRNLTSVARPSQRCRLVIDGCEFPPRSQHPGDSDYCESLATFNRLVSHDFFEQASLKLTSAHR